MANESVILGADGKPAVSASDQQALKTTAGRALKSFATYQRQLNLQMLGADPNLVAQQPFESHAWVYTAAMVQSLGIGGVEFQVFRETEDRIRERQRMAKRANRKFKLHRGSKRHSWSHYVKAPYRTKGLTSKALEPDPDNEVAILLNNPNPLMSGSQLWQATTLFMALLGEAFWIKTAADGQPWVPGTTPEQLWLIAPTAVKEIISNNQLVGWQVRIPKGVPIAQQGATINFRLDEIIHFKYVDPVRQWRGLAPITAAARGITLDLASSQTNYSTVTNGANPSGIMTTDQWLDESQRESIAAWIEEEWGGPNNAGHIPTSFGGLKFQATGLSPRDMEYLESRKWNRDEILSVFGVTKAAVGVTDDLNFATQLSQDRNLWTKRLLPLIMLYEAEVNKQLLGGETDDVVGLFMTQTVDALRLGMDEQIEMAVKLSDKNIHMPPAQALMMAGLEHPEYEGSDVALVPAGLVPASIVTTLTLDDIALGGNPESTPQENSLKKSDDDTVGAPYVKSPRRKARGGKIWNQLMISIEVPGERQLSKDWQKWVRLNKREQLEKFDKIVGLASAAAGKRSHDYNMRLTAAQLCDILVKAEPSDIPPSSTSIDSILLDLNDTQNALKLITRPTMMGIGESTFNFTKEELGGDSVVVFDYSAPSIQRVLDTAQNRWAGSSPKTLQRNIRVSLRKGLESGETLAQLRQRIAQQYDGFATPGKTLQVGRTETNTMLGNVRNETFNMQGINLREWTTAADENVRHDHQVFGEQAPQNSDFNYLTTVGESDQGKLTHPMDFRAPAGQVINCRCIHIAAI